MHRGYVRFWRKTVDSEFWSYGANAIALFSYLLLRANRKESWFKGERIGPGQVFCALREVAKELKVGHKAIRIALEVLQKSNVITTHARAQHGTLVTFTNWDTYNGDEDPRGTSKGTTGAQEGHSLKHLSSITKEPIEPTLFPDEPEKPKKERKVSDPHKVIAEYCRGFTERTGGNAQIAWETDTKAAKSAIQSQGLEKAMKLAYEYGVDPPGWNRDHGAVGFESFLKAINSLHNRKA